MDALLKSQIEAKLADSDGWNWKVFRSGGYRVRKENNFFGVGSDNKGEIFPVVIRNSENDEPIVFFSKETLLHIQILKKL